MPARGQRVALDDFGSKASFAALNSFAPTEVRRGVDRKFVETMVPLEVHNAGPGFVHYCAPGVYSEHSL
jgi:EAL domain-containing protein (putative c-di-GMP-specific phosphodiesterase class I)